MGVHGTKVGKAIHWLFWVWLEHECKIMYPLDTVLAAIKHDSPIILSDITIYTDGSYCCLQFTMKGFPQYSEIKHHIAGQCVAC